MKMTTLIQRVALAVVALVRGTLEGRKETLLKPRRQQARTHCWALIEARLGLTKLAMINADGVTISGIRSHLGPGKKTKYVSN